MAPNQNGYWYSNIIYIEHVPNMFLVHAKFDVIVQHARLFKNCTSRTSVDFKLQFGKRRYDLICYEIC